MTARYLTARVGQALIVLWAAFTVTFVGIELLPSDPITSYLATITNGSAVSPETVAAVKEYYGYDQGVVSRYLDQLLSYGHGDLGYSLQDSVSVVTRIGQVIGPTLSLALNATGIALVLAFGIVTGTTLTRWAWLSRLVGSIPPFLNSMPSFWLGILALQVFSFQLGVLPLYPDGSFISGFVPALVLGLAVTAPIAQVALKAVQDAYRQPFVVVLRAKGASNARIYFTHVLRHAAASVVTMLGLVIGYLLTGAIVVEKVFGRTGIGSVLEKSVTQQDVAVLQGFVLLVAAAYVLINLIVDLSYPVIDPRVRVTRERA